MIKKKENNGFTLIELIAVLVILAIIALIVTPLVLNVVRKAKDSANKRSVDAYGKSIDLAVASYLMDTGDFPTSISDLTIEYSGKEVVCGIQELNEDSSVYLSECTVDGKEVKDSNTDDGWYHYGTIKSIYDYKIGDQVTYNGMNFYVIENSDEASETVTMLKAEPLTVDEVNTYGAGHVNRYTFSSVGTAYDINGYGAVAYYTSETCGYNGSSGVYDGCTNEYAQSEVKYIVDAWAQDKFNSSDLKEDATGYSARLISLDDILNNMEYTSVWNDVFDYTMYSLSDSLDWLYKWADIDGFYMYWTMTPMSDSNRGADMWVISHDGYIESQFGNTNTVLELYNSSVVRPVVTIKKSAL